MKSIHLVMSLLWVLVMILGIDNWCNGCLEEERFALLQLKASMNYPNHTYLPSWKEDNDYLDCCQWEGVECNFTTHRVIKLSLSSIRNLGPHDYWHLNASILLPFESLRKLDLSENKLRGFVENEAFDGLKNLKELDLSFNNLGNNTTVKGLQILSNLSNLEELYISGNALDNSILPSLNKLSNLKILDLELNELKGTIDVKGLQILSNLSNLEELYIRGNALNNSILSSLNKLSNLKILDLEMNELKGTIDVKEFDGLSNLKELGLTGNHIMSINGSHEKSGMNKLETLYLGSNDLGGSIGSFLRGLSSLKTLHLSGNYNGRGAFHSPDLKYLTSIEKLYMDGTTLDNDFLPNIVVLTSLRVLSLRYCIFIGSLPVKGLCELKTIRELDIEGTGFGGTLPWCLMNLTSLRFLDIAVNNFTGNIAGSPLIHLTSLEYLRISDNDFEVPISFKSFFNNSKLKFIESLNNKLLEEEEILATTPSFQLIGICLSGPEHGKVIRSFPYFLYHQHDLVMVELSRIDMSAKFPNWLLHNNTRMEALFLPHNLFRGPLSLPSHPMKNLLTLDISNNFLEGFIPYKTPSFFPNIEYLNMSTNDFEGNIPTSFGDMTALLILDLSNNRLSGEIPVHLAEDCRLLRHLMLSNNNLKGPILPRQNNLTSLHTLYLDGNGFTEFPQTMSPLPFLENLCISHNQLVGNIPGWLGNMPSMSTLAMGNNHLEGPIPMEFCRLYSLFMLDLSGNNISGSIPSCLNMSQIGLIKLYKNRLHGPFPVAFRNNTYLQVLDLSHNQFSGKIPDWIDSLSGLTILLLKNNRFEDNIPNQLCHLSRLTMIDLSFNNLCGSIPSCMNNITFEEVHGKYPMTNIGQELGNPLFTSLLHDLVMVSENRVDLVAQRISNGMSIGQVEFQTKGMLLSYKGLVLDLFSGIDLSYNNLSGHIPLEIGNLSRVRTLNLAYNYLTGIIPATFSNLKNIESLDLSFNHLDGKIPSQLTELNFLSYFNLSSNNLSGSTPQRVAQFATFESGCYVGNPLLCGEPLPRKCNSIDSPPMTPRVINGGEEDFGLLDMDMDVLYMSFAGSYVTVVLAIVAILYINPHWRRVWFHLIEVSVTSCYYFVVDNLVWPRRGFP